MNRIWREIVQTQTYCKYFSIYDSLECRANNLQKKGENLIERSRKNSGSLGNLQSDLGYRKIEKAQKAILIHKKMRDYLDK